jgi:response regulator NasT
VELAGTLEPDVILMDVKMPRLDGIEAARRILERRSLPIVMLTAFGQEELVTRAVDTGVFGYLAKPFREQDVIPALVAAQSRHREFAEVKLQADSLLEALEARKAIERAKGILMAKEGISEDEAFARLRRASQKSGRPMKVIADAVAATLG